MTAAFVNRGMLGKVIALALLFSLTAGLLFAGHTDGMSGGNWMSYLPAGLSIGQVNMPGSHDAAAYNCKAGTTVFGHMANLFGGYFNCHKCSIADQFNMGVRNFDLRYVYDSRFSASSPYGGRDYVVCHGQAHCDDSNDQIILFFGGAIRELEGCLEANSNEFVIVTYQYETDFDGSYSMYAPSVDKNVARSFITEDIDQLCRGSDKFMRLEKGAGLPCVQEARGKIFFVGENVYNAHSSPWDTRFEDKKKFAKNHWDKCDKVNFSACTINAEEDISLAMPRVVTISFCDLDSPIEVVGFDTGYYNESGKATEWIAEGGYVFKPWTCYGSVMMNFVTEKACQKVYESNLFGIPRPLMPFVTVGYDGVEKSVAPYVEPGTEDYLEFSGTFLATETGDYSFVASPKAPWEDSFKGDYTPMEFKWRLAVISVPVPSLVADTFAYDGTEKCVKLDIKDWHYAPYYELGGEWRASAPGNYVATVTPLVWWPEGGGKAPKELAWRIEGQEAEFTESVPFRYKGEIGDFLILLPDDIMACSLFWGGIPGDYLEVLADGVLGDATEWVTDFKVFSAEDGGHTDIFCWNYLKGESRGLPRGEYALRHDIYDSEGELLDSCGRRVGILPEPFFWGIFVLGVLVLKGRAGF